MHKRSADEHLVLGICLISFIGLVPFFFIRLNMGEWVVAGIDLIGALFAAFSFRHVYRTRQTKLIAPAVALLALSGMTANIAVLGSTDFYFFYPVLIFAFFLMPPLLALISTSIATIITTSIAYTVLPVFIVMELVFSLAGTILFSFIFAWQRNSQRDELHKQSRMDELTGVRNRRAMNEQLTELITLHERDKQPMSLVILDLDDFKKVNDAHGHIIGDEVLKKLAATMQTRIRASDYLYRYGGDEFLILANNSDAKTAHTLAEDIRQLISQESSITKERITVSIGVSEFRKGETAQEWLLRADKAMYSVKHSGKNAVAQFNNTLFDV
jgi:diguanylate cyclase (GGDEF)-like protein